MKQNKVLLALDVGEKRIGVAVSDGIVRIARPLKTIEVDGDEINKIIHYIGDEKVGAVIIGYPRNQSGEATAQTEFVADFSKRLGKKIKLPFVFQDESLTSILAEERLRSYKKPYAKGDIDALAATMILQDYLEKV